MVSLFNPGTRLDDIRSLTSGSTALGGSAMCSHPGCPPEYLLSTASYWQGQCTGNVTQVCQYHISALLPRVDERRRSSSPGTCHARRRPLCGQKTVRLLCTCWWP